MTVFQEPIKNIAGAADGRAVEIWATETRQTPGGTGITTTDRAEIYPDNTGLLTTPDLTPGTARVKVGGKIYDITIDDSDTPLLLSEAIELGSAIPPDTPQSKLEAAVAGYIDSGATEILTQTVADATYAPIDDPRFDGIGGGSGLSVTDNGDGTLTLTDSSGTLVTDNGDGTLTLTA